jgi:hypothetical protein
VTLTRRKTNLARTAGISPQLIEYLRWTRWDGRQPAVVGAETPLLSVPLGTATPESPPPAAADRISDLRPCQERRPWRDGGSAPEVFRSPNAGSCPPVPASLPSLAPARGRAIRGNPDGRSAAGRYARGCGADSAADAADGAAEGSGT